MLLLFPRGVTEPSMEWVGSQISTPASPCPGCVTCGWLWQVLLQAGAVLCARGGVWGRKNTRDEGKGCRMLPNPTLVKTPGLSPLPLLSPPAASLIQELDPCGPFQLFACERNTQGLPKSSSCPVCPRWHINPTRGSHTSAEIIPLVQILAALV